MKRIITLKLYKDNRLENTFSSINSIFDNDAFLFTLEGTKMNINPKQFIRENNEFRFNLDIEKETSTYLLKEQNMELDIDVLNVKYTKKQNKYILEYKLTSDDSNMKIEIILEGE